MRTGSKGLKTLKVLGNVLLWIFVLIAAIMTIFAFSAQKNDNGVVNVFGKIPVTVLSDSMKGTFGKGTLIIDDALSTEEKAGLQVNDIITFVTDLDGDGIDELNTHRITQVSQREGYTYYTTMGDNRLTNTSEDEQEVRYDMVVGKYTGLKVPGLGSVISFLQTPTAFLLCIVLPLCLFFLYEIYRFISITVSMRTKKSVLADEEEIKKKAIEEYLAQQNEVSEAEVPETVQQEQ